MDTAIVCDDEELEAYDVKQDGTTSLTAFVASEAGKVRVFFLPSPLHCRRTNRLDSAIQNHVLDKH